jgi:hypothetical protein
MRTPLVVMLVLCAALYGLWALTAGSSSGGSAAEAARRAPVAEIAHRVEGLRGLRYHSIPRAVAVTPAQAEREGLEDLDRSYPPARRHADEEVLKLLGLVPAGLSLRDVSAATFSQGVAGYYDPRTKRLRTVSGAATGTRVLTEMVLAHELTHALEDQRFGLSEDSSGDDDAALARLALIEGSATDVMYRYVQRFFTPEQTLGGLLSSAFADTGSLPPFLESQLVFPYTGGQRFVQSLLERAGGRWTLVDLADGTHPPASTEQVMHPDRYIAVDAPMPVRLRVGEALGSGWRRAAAGTWGEFQTGEMLADAGGGGSSEAAAGWGGDRYELWTRGTCGTPPCRSDDVLVMRWRWDTPADEREFAAKLRQWVRDGLGPVKGGVAVVEEQGGAVTLLLAPDAATAARLEGRA